MNEKYILKKTQNVCLQHKKLTVFEIEQIGGVGAGRQALLRHGHIQSARNERHVLRRSSIASARKDMRINNSLCVSTCAKKAR